MKKNRKCNNFSIQNDIEENIKRKLPNPKIERKPKQNAKIKSKSIEIDENVQEIKEDIDQLSFNGISEKDPSFNNVNLNEIEYPNWLKKENLKDSNGKRKQIDPDYDPSTLYIPPKDFENLSPVFKQYWEVKCKNFDKILFFRFGFLFYCYYDDAIEISKISDSKLAFWGTRPYTMIYPTTYPILKEKLISLNYKVITMEQMETEETKKDVIIKREVIEILSKGTVTNENFWGSSDSKFLLCIVQKNNKFGLCFFDAMTQKFFLDEVHKEEDFESIIVRIKPVEIVFSKKHMDTNLINFLKDISSPMFSPISHYLPLIEEIRTELTNFFEGTLFFNL